MVTLDVLDKSAVALQAEVIDLRGRLSKMLAVARLFWTLLRVLGVSLEKRRLPEGADKAALLAAIERAQEVLPTRVILRHLRLSESRFHAWKRTEPACGLDDRRSCPRRSTNSLTPAEIMSIKEIVLSPEYRHMPTGRLAILAQRLGKVIASTTTWCRLVRERGWRRPRGRVYPESPKVSVRASRPDEKWHVDVTVIRLVNGVHIYLHAVLDNFSRRIIAFKVAEKLDSGNAVMVLLEAAARSVGTGDTPPTFVCDGGPENVNGRVDELIEAGVLRRLIARTDVTFSNSLVEAWFRTLKHQWLFLNDLDSIAAVRRLVVKYINAHNTEIPHAAHQGQTPDEMYFGTGEDVPAQLEARREEAREARRAANKRGFCGRCRDGGAAPAWAAGAAA